MYADRSTSIPFPRSMDQFKQDAQYPATISHTPLLRTRIEFRHYRWLCSIAGMPPSSFVPHVRQVWRSRTQWPRCRLPHIYRRLGGWYLNQHSFFRPHYLDRPQCPHTLEDHRTLSIQLQGRGRIPHQEDIRSDDQRDPTWRFSFFPRYPGRPQLPHTLEDHKSPRCIQGRGRIHRQGDSQIDGWLKRLLRYASKWHFGREGRPHMWEGGKILLRIRVQGRNDHRDTRIDGQQDPTSCFVCSCRAKVEMPEYLWVKFSSLTLLHLGWKEMALRTWGSWEH